MTLANNVSYRNKNKGSRAQTEAAAKLLDLDARKFEGIYYDDLADVQRKLPLWNPGIPMDENVNHINVSIQSRSDLGKALHPDFNLPWTHPEFGEFLSIRAFWQFILGEKADDRLRTMHSRELKEYAQNRRGMTPRSQMPNFQALTLIATYYRIQSLPGLKEMLMDSHLGLDSYQPANREGPARRNEFASWFIPGLEIIRFALLKSEKPNFSDFMDARQTVEDTTRQLLSRERFVVPTLKSVPNLGEFLAKGSAPAKVKNQAGSKDKPKASPKDPTKQPAPKKAKPQVKVQSNTQKPTSQAEKYIKSLESAKLEAVVLFKTRSEAIAFIMKSMGDLALSESGKLDIDIGGGTLLQAAEMIGEENLATTASRMAYIPDANVAIYSHDGETNMMRLISTDFTDPYQPGVTVKFPLPIDMDAKQHISEVTGCPKEYIVQLATRIPKAKPEAEAPAQEPVTEQVD